MFTVLLLLFSHANRIDLIRNVWRHEVHIGHKNMEKKWTIWEWNEMTSKKGQFIGFFSPSIFHRFWCEFQYLIAEICSIFKIDGQCVCLNVCVCGTDAEFDKNRHFCCCGKLFVRVSVCCVVDWENMRINIKSRGRRFWLYTADRAAAIVHFYFRSMHIFIDNFYDCKFGHFICM